MDKATGKSPLSWARAAIVFAAGCLACSAFGWVYPEHRDIAMLAVQHLDADRSALFNSLWQQARQGDETRLCAEGADAKQDLTPECLDWAALSAIAGDHSCSSAEMLDSVTRSDWILVVADIAAQLKADLARIPVTSTSEQQAGGGVSATLEEARRRLVDEASRARRMNALRTADTRLQRADTHYATRADANRAHFPLPRPDTSLDPGAYGQIALRAGAPINAAGVYVWFHLSALGKAARLAAGGLSEPQRRALARAILFDEAFALHFLEDLFAAGHLAGSWGDVSQRKGTHDYYNENGLEVFTWSGRDKTIVLMGDAHMRPEDAEVAAKTVEASLAQVLDVAAGRAAGAPQAPGMPGEKLQPDAFDICKGSNFPETLPGQGATLQAYLGDLREVLLTTPVPGLGPGLGTQPRARSEVGTYVGIAAAIEGRGISGGFLASQSGRGAMGGLDLGVRFGLGLEGALGEAGDGRFFIQVGLHADTYSSNSFSETGVGAPDGNLTAAIPSRTGLSTRFRAPYYLIPGDLLLLAPLYWLSPDTYTNLAVVASNGGLLGWQQGWGTRFGLFQFVLGRELGVTWYGLGRSQQLLIPSSTGGVGDLVNFKSVYFDLPIVEYRPYRAFSSNQSSSLLFQLYYGADVPQGGSGTGLNGTSSVDLRTVQSIGLRLVFDWRYYW